MVHHLPELKEKGVPNLIPGVPITCKVDNTEKYTTRSKVKLKNSRCTFLKSVVLVFFYFRIGLNSE